MKRFTFLFGCLFFALFAAGCGRSPIRPQPLAGIENVDLQGHRGARGWRPENTWPAFEFCMESNMTTIEMDTVVTRDGQFIVMHDNTVNPQLCLDAAGQPAKAVRAADLTAEELRQFDCGSRRHEKFPDQQPVPGTRLMTLPEFFGRIRVYESQHPDRPTPRFNIEIKFDRVPGDVELEKIAGRMVGTILAAGVVDRTTVQCFVPALLPHIKRLNPAIKTSALFQPTYFKGILMVLGLDADRAAIIQKTREAGADIISPYHLYANARFVQTCHDQNLEVIPWTVNEEKIMWELLDNGVDGMISDYPDRLYHVYRQWLDQQ